MTRHLDIEGYELLPISASIDRASFTCGTSSELDRWIREMARQTAADRLDVTYVLVETGNLVCRAYYTVKPVVIQLAQVPRATRRWKRGDAPALLLTKMAVASDLQGRGLGSQLLADAMIVALGWSSLAGGAAMIVDAKNAEARRFYERAGFVAIEDRRLYLPMWHIEAWAKGAGLL